jgi:3-keto-disaccharide hydrolase
MKKRSMLALLFLVCAAIQMPAKELGWKDLFNGHNLKGWEHVGPGGFTVQGGLLKTQGGMGLLYWGAGPVADCEIKVVYKMEHENDNSGVFIRIPSQPTDPWMAVNSGYEVQIDNHPERGNEDDTHVTGTLYSMTTPKAKPGKPGPEWNTMVIRIEGTRTQVFVNDARVTDYTEGQPVPEKKLPFEPTRGVRPEKGWIGLQNHSDKDVVYFKTVAIRVLGSEQGYLP